MKYFTFWRVNWWNLQCTWETARRFWRYFLHLGSKVWQTVDIPRPYSCLILVSGMGCCLGRVWRSVWCVATCSDPPGRVWRDFSSPVEAVLIWTGCCELSPRLWVPGSWRRPAHLWLSGLHILTPGLRSLGAHAQRGYCSCVCVCVCVSVTLHLTFRMFVRLTNDMTYSTGNEGQNFVGFSLKMLRCKARALPALYG